MKKLAELEEMVRSTLATKWQRREGKVVPASADIRLGNDAVELDAVVLYADLADSTGLVTGFKDWFAAEVYKSYLACASELIKGNGGTITAYDGDRVMGVFIGSAKNTSATRCALQISYVVSNVINAQIQSTYKNTAYEVRQTVGIDASKVFVAKAGIHGVNDLVWIGRSPNYAAKLCALRDGGYKTQITEEVYDALRDELKFSSPERRSIWTKFIWAEKGIPVYGSSWWIKPD